MTHEEMVQLLRSKLEDAIDISWLRVTERKEVELGIELEPKGGYIGEAVYPQFEEALVKALGDLLSEYVDASDDAPTEEKG